MQKQKIEVKVIVLIVLVIFWILMATAFGIQNKRHKDVIEIYEEYYVLDEEMDIMYRVWSDWYPQYDEEEYYFKYHPEKYLRYLKLKKIIGEFEK